MKKIKFLPVLLALVLFAACGEPVRNNLDDIAAKTETIELYITNKAVLNEMLSQTMVEGKPLVSFKNIDNMAGNIFKYISDETTPEYKCGSDGVFKFLAGGKVLLELEFNLNKDCRHFAFSSEGKVQFRKITPEGVKYFSKILMVEGL
jgi:hypothetical protein